MLQLCAAWLLNPEGVKFGDEKQVFMINLGYPSEDLKEQLSKARIYSEYKGNMYIENPSYPAIDLIGRRK